MTGKLTKYKSRGAKVAQLEVEVERLEAERDRLRSDFNAWWARNHPLDWWSSAPHRKGQSMNHGDRLLVRALCQRAYEHNSALTNRQDGDA